MFSAGVVVIFENSVWHFAHNTCPTQKAFRNRTKQKTSGKHGFCKTFFFFCSPPLPSSPVSLLQNVIHIKKTKTVRIDFTRLTVEIAVSALLGNGQTSLKFRRKLNVPFDGTNIGSRTRPFWPAQCVWIAKRKPFFELLFGTTIDALRNVFCGCSNSRSRYALDTFG